MKAKNIGLLATLALVTTVGGVYATFNYATESAKLADTETAKGAIEGVKTTNSKGTLVVSFTDPVIQFYNAGNNTAQLTVSGKVVVTFDSAGSALVGDTIHDFGLENIKVTAAITNSTVEDVYKSEEIFKINTAGVTLARADATHTVPDRENATHVYTTDLSNLISIGDDRGYHLGELASYNALKKVAEGTTFTISAVEV